MGPKPELARKTFKAVGLLAFLVMVGCSAPSMRSEELSQAPSYSGREYRIQPGDQLDIKLFYNPELNELLTVRPDGRITLQLINDVLAAGLTPAELTAVLTKAYAVDLANPKVAVIVRSSVADRVFVDGEVNRAGLIPLIGPTTILQAISQAGGIKDTAKGGEVILLRKTEGQLTPFRITLGVGFHGGANGDIQLQPNDIVYVPRSAISNVNVWVDQYIRKNIPIPLGLSLGTFD